MDNLRLDTTPALEVLKRILEQGGFSAKIYVGTPSTTAPTEYISLLSNGGVRDGGEYGKQVILASIGVRNHANGERNTTRLSALYAEFATALSDHRSMDGFDFHVRKQAAVSDVTSLHSGYTNKLINVFSFII